MDKNLIKEILEYIELVEEQIDSEYDCRSFEQILKEHTEENKLIPDFYFALKEMLN